MRRVITLLLCVPLLGSLSASSACGSEVLSALLDEQQCKRYVPPSQAQLLRARELFLDLLKQRADDKTISLGAKQAQREAWAALGFSLHVIQINKQDWWLLREAQERCRGYSVFLFRATARHALMVQAPHRFHDIRTADLAAAFVRQDAADIVVWNTVARYTRARGERAAADLAHRDNSYMQALTWAYARVEPGAAVVQLHGFSRKKRKTRVGAAASVILSSGEGHTSARVLSTARCLQGSALGSGVLVYPRDVLELGGTKNKQGDLLHGMGRQGFVHIELSRQTRERLLSDERMREAFVSCISTGGRP